MFYIYIYKENKNNQIHYTIESPFKISYNSIYHVILNENYFRGNGKVMPGSIVTDKEKHNMHIKIDSVVSLVSTDFCSSRYDNLRILNSQHIFIWPRKRIV